MSDQPRDLAGLYLAKLQTGYRIEEFSFASITVGQLLMPINPNRVLVFFAAGGGLGGVIGFRTPGGLLLPWMTAADNRTVIATTKDHLIVPSFEWVGTDNMVAAVQALAIIKK